MPIMETDKFNSEYAMNTLFELDIKLSVLQHKATELTSLKKRLYSNVDIESPMSISELELNRDTAHIYS